MTQPSLDIEVTRRCNLRCEYCFVGWSRDWVSDMPYETALQIIEEGSGLFPMLHFTGGETFTYPRLFDLIEAGLARDYPEILINTNGTLLTPEIAQRLAAYGSRLSISVSLDGPENLHDSARGKGRFRDACRGLQALLDAGVRVTVMTVVTPAVLEVLSPFINDIFDNYPGITGVTLFPVGVGPAGSQKPGSKLHPLTPEQLQELALTVALLYRVGFPIMVGAYPIVNPLLLNFGYPADKLYQCTAGRGRVCVHADLSVSSCHPVKEAIYGTWQSGLLNKLSKFSAHQTLAQRDFEGCRSCAQQEACGHCRAFVTASGASLFGNDRICHEVLPAAMREAQMVMQ